MTFIVSFREHQVVDASDGKKHGVVRFLGETEFMEGDWVGVELPTSTGKNDGSVKGKRYFSCKDRCGFFARPNFVSKSIKEVVGAGEGSREDDEAFDNQAPLSNEERDNIEKLQPDQPRDSIWGAMKGVSLDENDVTTVWNITINIAWHGHLPYYYNHPRQEMNRMSISLDASSISLADVSVCAQNYLNGLFLFSMS